MLNSRDRWTLSVMLVFELIGVDKQLRQMMTVGGEQLKVFLREGKYKSLVDRIEKEEAMWKQRVSEPHYLTMESEVTIVERLLIARMIQPANELKIYESLITIILGEEYLSKEVNLTTLQTFLRSSPIVLLKKSEDYNIANFFGDNPVVYVKRLEQL